MTAVVGVMFPCTLYTRGHSTGPKLCGKLQNSSSLTSEVWNFLVLKVCGVLPGGRAAMINTAGKTRGRLRVSTPTAAGRGLKENISIKATLDFKSSICLRCQTKHKYKLNINPTTFERKCSMGPGCASAAPGPNSVQRVHCGAPPTILPLHTFQLTHE